MSRRTLQDRAPSRDRPAEPRLARKAAPVVIYGAMRIALPVLTLLLTATPALAQGLTVERLPRG